MQLVKLFCSIQDSYAILGRSVIQKEGQFWPDVTQKRKKTVHKTFPLSDWYLADKFFRLVLDAPEVIETRASFGLSSGARPEGSIRRDGMPATRCPACGYRNTQTTLPCINCGQILDELARPLAMESEVAPVSALLARRAFLPPGAESVSRSAVIVSHPLDDISPYQSASQDQIPFISAMPLPTIPSTVLSAQEMHSPLPFGFAWTRPALCGAVIQIEVHEQIDTFPNIGGAISIILSEVFWAILNVQTTREAADKIEITSLRIQTEDKHVHDVSVRGSQRGAHLSMGDTVSLWGHRRKGNLIVRKGYDHTTRSRISSTALSAFWPALLLLLIVGALYLFISHKSLVDVFTFVKALPVEIKKIFLPK
jgi:hypothetical protein